MLRFIFYSVAIFLSFFGCNNAIQPDIGCEDTLLKYYQCKLLNYTTYEEDETYLVIFQDTLANNNEFKKSLAALNSITSRNDAMKFVSSIYKEILESKNQNQTLYKCWQVNFKMYTESKGWGYIFEKQDRIEIVKKWIDEFNTKFKSIMRNITITNEDAEVFQDFCYKFRWGEDMIQTATVSACETFLTDSTVDDCSSLYTSDKTIDAKVFKNFFSCVAFSLSKSVCPIEYWRYAILAKHLYMSQTMPEDFENYMNSILYSKNMISTQRSTAWISGYPFVSAFKKRDIVGCMSNREIECYKSSKISVYCMRTITTELNSKNSMMLTQIRVVFKVDGEEYQYSVNPGGFTFNYKNGSLIPEDEIKNLTLPSMYSTNRRQIIFDLASNTHFLIQVVSDKFLSLLVRSSDESFSIVNGTLIEGCPNEFIKTLDDVQSRDNKGTCQKACKEQSKFNFTQYPSFFNVCIFDCLRESDSSAVKYSDTLLSTLQFIELTDLEKYLSGNNSPSIKGQFILMLVSIIILFLTF